MAKIKTEADKEAVLVALDQLSQTMDVMRQVVGRLKHSIESAQLPTVSAARPPREDTSSEEEWDRTSSDILH